MSIGVIIVLVGLIIMITYIIVKFGLLYRKSKPKN